MTKPIKAASVVKYILDIKGALPTFYLHKLCYYMQAYSLAVYDEPLFVDKIYAWPNTPVVISLFYYHGKSLEIDRLMFGGGKGGYGTMSKEQREVIDYVLTELAIYNISELQDMVYNDKPWKFARRNLSGVCANKKGKHIITLDYIRCLNPWGLIDG